MDAPWKSSDKSMKSTYAREQPFLSGETVTGGTFRCLACGEKIEKAPGTVSNLPVCPSCQADRWEAA